VRRREVIEMVLYGAASERTLYELAQLARDALLQSPEITQVDIVGARPLEVHVNVPRETLRAHGLTLQDVAARIQAASVERPGGGIRTRGGEILLRVTDRRDWAEQFATIPLLTSPSGRVIRLGDLAGVTEGFEDIDRYTLFNGQPSIGLEIYRVGDQTPIGVSEETRRIMAQLEPSLPEGVHWDIHDDESIVYVQRLELLVKNMLLGLLLVLILLGLFLEARVAFWVTMGIPISFLGGLLLLPGMDVSINMMSMFAFIVSLGIVVDDAIVAGENIYEYRSRGMSYVQAAIRGARDVAGPIGFSILTNVLAFLPLAFVPGYIGKIWKVIPIVVITVFLISWLESLLILPSHLAHGRDRRNDPHPGPFTRFQRLFNRGVVFFAARIYGPSLALAVRWRLVVLGIAVATLIAAFGWVQSGRIGIILMPRIERDEATVEVAMPPGTPVSVMETARDQLLAALDGVVAEHGGEQLLLGTLARIDNHSLRVEAFLQPPGVRPLRTSELSRLWREATGRLEGAERVRFEFDRGGPGSGAALTIELSHRSVATLERASVALAARLAEFPNVADIHDGRSDGKPQLDFRLTPQGESLGLTSGEIARQVRSAFYGAEALRQLREADEIRVLVRPPEAERSSEHDVESLLVATPNGRYVPLREVATVARGQSFTTISRRGGRRITNVTCNVEPLGETNQVMAALDASVLPQLLEDFPGLSTAYRGRQHTMRESMSSLYQGFLLALFAIYFLLAIPFRSYSQPIIVMIAIPFGMVGALIGHILMGYDVSLMSQMGLVALSGVLINDSLLLVDYANKRRAEGMGVLRAIREAGVRRFRPVLLTTLTTFGGLAPMIFETSRQARFMIPMALSLGFGILFATAITLVLVPSLYVLVDDLVTLPRRVVGWVTGRRGVDRPGIGAKGV
jgi:multidrug efflux pump subunit AcrB